MGKYLIKSETEINVPNSKRPAVNWVKNDEDDYVRYLIKEPWNAIYTKGATKLYNSTLDSSYFTLFKFDDDYDYYAIKPIESNVKGMEYMFKNCSSLTSLDLSNWNNSKVTGMSQMFYGCSSLQTLDVSNFNTSNVTSMSFMFSNCSSLKSLDLSNFDTSKVTDMSYMFSNCYSLKSLDLSGWDMSNATYASNMFANCSSLQTIYARGCNSATITKLNSAKPYKATIITE